MIFQVLFFQPAVITAVEIVFVKKPFFNNNIRLYSLGLPLISVNYVESSSASGTTSSRQQKEIER